MLATFARSLPCQFADLFAYSTLGTAYADAIIADAFKSAVARLRSVALSAG